PPTNATSNQAGNHGAGHGEREHHRRGTRESGEDRGGHDRDRDDRSRWMHARTDEETERYPSENREQRDVPHAVPVDEPGDESHRVAGRKRRDGQKPERDGHDRHCRERDRARAPRLPTNAEEPTRKADEDDGG